MWVWYTVVALLLSAQSSQGQTDLINRLNFGVLFKPIKTLNVYTATAKLVFIVDLPEPQTVISHRLNCSRVAQAINSENATVIHRTAQDCLNLSKTVQTVFNAQKVVLQSLVNHMNSLHSMIEIFEPQTRTRRSWIPQIGAIFNQIFGLTDEYTFASLQKIVKHLEERTLRQLEIWSQGSDHVTSLVRINNDRISNLANMVKNQQATLDRIYNAFQAQRMRNAEESDLTIKALQLTIESVKHLSDVNTLIVSIGSLINGKLPPKIVKQISLQNELNRLTYYLNDNHPHLQIVHKNLFYYYNSAKITTTRKNESVIIILHVPLTSIPEPLMLFEIIPIPLEIPGDTTFSQTDSLPHAIAYNPNSDYYVTFETTIQIPVSDYLDVKTTPAQLHPRSIPSCILALLDGKTHDINKLCKYHVTDGNVKPQIIRLSPKQVFLSNIPEILLACDSGYSTTNQLITINHTQVVYEIGCQCSLTANDLYLPAVADLCLNENDTVTELHPLNLRILQEYFSQTELFGLEADTLLKNKINISIPKLLLSVPELDNNFEKQLAFENTAKFDLQTVINATKTGQNSFRSLTDYIYQNILENQSQDSNFNVFNLWHWFYLICSIAGILALAASVILSWRLRVLTAVVLSQKVTVSAHGQLIQLSTTAINIPRILHYRATTTMATKLPNFSLNTTALNANMVDYLKSYLPIELSIWMIAGMIFTILACILIYRHWPHCRDATNIGLEIGNISEYIIIKWSKFPHSPACYNFTVTNLTACATLTLHRAFLTTLKLQSDNLSIAHNILDCPINLTTSKLLDLWTARITARILSKPHYIMLSVTDITGVQVESVLLRSISPVTSNISSHCNSAFDQDCPVDDRKIELRPSSQLYPSLDGCK